MSRSVLKRGVEPSSVQINDLFNLVSRRLTSLTSVSTAVTTSWYGFWFPHTLSHVRFISSEVGRDGLVEGFPNVCPK